MVFDLIIAISMTYIYNILDWFASINLNDTELDFLLHLQFCLAGQSLIIQTG